MPLEVETNPLEPDLLVVKFSGKITLGTESQDIEAQVQSLIQQDTKKFIFDLTGVEYVDSTGALILTHCFFAVRTAGGRVRFAGAQDRVRRVFSATKLDTVMPFDRTVPDAEIKFK